MVFPSFLEEGRVSASDLFCGIGTSLFLLFSQFLTFEEAWVI